jgi:hypothetical protein
MPVTFHRLAAAEFVAARRWYAVRSPAVEARFVAAVAVAVRRIDTTPTGGSPWVGPIRWVRVRRYPYTLYYEEVTPGNMQVYAVAHTRRQPGYWIRRTTRP